MAEAERFFSTPSAGDSGAPPAPPNTPSTLSSRKKKKSLASAHSATKLKKHSSGSSHSVPAKDPTGLSGIRKISRPLSGFNLAGRPGFLQTKELGTGIKSLTKKICRPTSQSTINTDTEWNFAVTSHKGEFIRFFANSMTVSLYSTFPNAAYEAAGGTEEIRTRRHSTRALNNQPKVFFDPSVMGTSIIKSVRVSINGVPVQSNNFVDPHLMHYVRCSRIFNGHPEPFLAKESSMNLGADRTTHSLAMKTALRPFDTGVGSPPRGRVWPCWWRPSSSCTA